MSRSRLFLVGISGFFLLLIVGSWVERAYMGTIVAGSRITIEIADAETDIGAMATFLEEKGIITSAIGYRLYAAIDQEAHRAKSGSYAIQPGASYQSIAHMLALGPERRESQVLLIEGWTVNDEIESLAKEKGIDTNRIRASIGASVDQAPFDTQWRKEFSFIRDLPKTRSLEGYLFPSTYRVWDDQLPEGLVRKQLQAFEKRFVGESITTASAPLKTLDEVVILASIVEKEVALEKDRGIVAGIFLNRLRIGMALQSDATVRYITDSNRARATNEDLSSDSPYNTYKHAGLPPGPIANPGESAMRAVLNPTPTDYLYFLTDRGGRAYYATTHEGHLKNRQTAGY